ncbi:MAG: Dethiobiotin synthase [Bacteroidota bacterium]|jgi:dethiobiotin synthetase
MKIIIAGIHTGIGKTVCSAAICQGLGFDYWKPVQAGDLDQSDSHFIKNHVTHPHCKIHPEAYRLNTPMSPHEAARLDGIEIQLSNFQEPKTENNLVIETAGGILSPLAAGIQNMHLIEQLKHPVILVTNHYLGSINHTLLSITALRQKNIHILGMVISGVEVPSTASYLIAETQLPVLFRIPQLAPLNAASLAKFVQENPISLT